MKGTHVHQLDRAQIERWYVTEQISENAIGKRLGVDRGTIRARLIEWGIPRRGIVAANRLVGQRMSAAQRRKRAVRIRGIHARGTPYTEAALRKKAETVHRNQRLSKYEQAIFEQSLSVPLEALYPFGRYNLDLAIPAHRVAIEIHGGWHGTRRKRAADRTKAEALAAAGWTLLVFDRQAASSSDRPDFDTFIDQTVRAIATHYQRLTAA